MVMALNNSSTSLSWTPPPYNCSLNYAIEVLREQTLTEVFIDSAKSTLTIVTVLMVGESYMFRVASVDAAERMSNWSQPVSLAMKGLPLFCDSLLIRLCVNE